MAVCREGCNWDCERAGYVRGFLQPHCVLSFAHEPEIDKELVRPAKRDTTAIKAALGVLDVLARPHGVTSTAGVTRQTRTVHW